MEPVKKVYRKMLLTIRSLFSVLDLRHDSMQKHVGAAIKSRFENAHCISFMKNVSRKAGQEPNFLIFVANCLRGFVPKRFVCEGARNFPFAAARWQVNVHTCSFPSWLQNARRPKEVTHLAVIVVTVVDDP